MKNKTKCYCGHTDYCDCIPLEELKQETLKLKRNYEKEFVHYDLALELKKLGFKEKCLAAYCGEPEIRFRVLEKNTFINDKSSWVTTPLWQQAFDWFRYVMLLDNFIIPYWFIDGEYKVKKYTYSIEPSNRFDEYFDCDSDEYDTYKDAELECLKKLIELAKEQNVK